MSFLRCFINIHIKGKQQPKCQLIVESKPKGHNSWKKNHFGFMWSFAASGKSIHGIEHSHYYKDKMFNKY